jgi:nicotinamide-nucleotide amidase
MEIEAELAGEPGSGEDPAFLVLSTARRARLTVAVAESLTGGRVAAALTAVPGASAVLRGSVTAYATDLKASLLGVDAALLSRVGAVDGEVARQMAVGVRRVCGADLGIATTGVAGPEGQDGKPVGTVFVAVVGPDDDRALVVPARFEGDRAAIQREATRLALANAVAHLTSWAAG